MQDYAKFIEDKHRRITDSGFDIDESEINPLMFEFQKHVLRIATHKGKFAVFADCGLGKTLIQLNWAQVVATRTSKPVLILAPLAVSAQTINEGAKFGIDIVRANSSDDIIGDKVFITNYERIDKFDCRAFSGVVLDESSILKNYAGATKTKIIESFINTPYKLCCTATPSPNDFMEFGNHSEFLNVMSRSEMLSYFFVHDMDDTKSWRLKGHAVEIFYQWMSSWAIFLSKPSDIGFPDNGFILPPLNILEKMVITSKVDNGRLFNDISVDATQHNSELRRTKTERMNLAAQIANSTDDAFIVWIKHNEEGDILKKLIPGAVEVRGSDDIEVKEQRLLGFAAGDFRVLITKTKIAQFGMNYQNCHNQIFASLDFSFESVYQATRRSYRFMQQHAVNIYMITTDTMNNVSESLRRKETDFNTMKESMRERMHTDFTAYQSKLPSDFVGVKGNNFTMQRGDCVELSRMIPDKSIDFSVFSPPFADLYTYSDSPNDMGNCTNYDEFTKHFAFLVAELKRIMVDGRIVAVHCMDLPINKQREGFIGVRDFPGELIRTFVDAGFIYHCRVTIWKDPVTAMQRTKALGLLHKQIRKDSAMSRVGLADYLLVFRNSGENPKPLAKTDLPVSLWQKYASPVWMDINQSKTLQFRSARHENDEKHICPLQLDVIERALHLWSRKGDLVYSPFAGIGSEGFVSLTHDRKFIGHELKDTYFQQASNNLTNLERDMHAQVPMELMYE